MPRSLPPEGRRARARPSAVNRRRCLVAALVVAAGAVGAAPASASNQTVFLHPNEYVFLPERVAIEPGESVVWNNPGSEEPHNVRFEHETDRQEPATAFVTQPRIFPTAGDYRYYCEVHGGPGGSGMHGWVYVNATGELPPLAKFSVWPNPAVTGELVTFDAAASTATAGRSITSYEWDLNANGSFGDPDDATGTSPTTSRTYLLAQDLKVGLRVTDSQGATGVYARWITIQPALGPSPDPPASTDPGPPSPAPQPQPDPQQPGTAPSGATATSDAFSFRAAATASRARGVPVELTCGGRCRFSVALSITATVARRTRLGRRAMTLGTARGTLTAAGTRSLTVKLAPRTRRRMTRLGSVPALLKLAVVGPSGATARKQRSVRLKR